MTQPAGEKDVAKSSPQKAAGKKVPKLSLAKPPDPPPPPHWIKRLFRAPATIAAIWPLLLVVGAYIAWQTWGADRIGQQFYGLDRETLTVTTPPDYVQSDVVKEVFKDHQLEKTSLLSRDATTKIGMAFRTHPWVAEVLRVEKRGDGVSVHLRYRTPVAVVRVKDTVQKEWIFFVDGDGVLLPTDDFEHVDQYNYIQIEVNDGNWPVGGYGSPFGDQRVMAAAQIAELLVDLRDQPPRLVAIRLKNPLATYNESFIYELIRADGSVLIWGSAPGEEVDGELAAADKLRLLTTGGQPPNDLRVASQLD